MNGKLLLAGLQLMVFGMGMVYVFLIIMIGCMKLLSKVLAPLAAKEAAAKAAAAKAAAAKSSAAAVSSDDAALAAAAVAAVAAARR